MKFQQKYLKLSNLLNYRKFICKLKNQLLLIIKNVFKIFDLSLFYKI